MTKKAVLTIPEFSEKYGICTATTYNEIRRGRLEAIKLASRTVITEEAEKTYLATRPRLPATAAQ